MLCTSCPFTVTPSAGCFETPSQDLRALLRLAAGRPEEPTAAIIDSRTLRSTPKSGTRAGDDGTKRKRGPKVHMTVDTFGHLPALRVTPAGRDPVSRSPGDLEPDVPLVERYDAVSFGLGRI